LTRKVGESVWAPTIRNVGCSGRFSGMRQTMTAPSRTNTYPPGALGNGPGASSMMVNPASVARAATSAVTWLGVGQVWIKSAQSSRQLDMIRVLALGVQVVLIGCGIVSSTGLRLTVI